jgi:hypothetical protein
MTEWLSIPRLIDLILLGMALEALWLRYRHRQQGHRGVPPVMLHLLSGALLLIAMRLALADVPPLLTAAVLGFAGIFHAIDIHKALFSRP